MAEHSKKRTGSLYSELRIELHSHYAIGLWQGRRVETGEDGTVVKSGIIGMPQFLNKASLINQDSLRDNPWADAAMLKMDDQLIAAGSKMADLIEQLDKNMQWLPKGATLSEVISSEPLDIHVYSNTPLGYRCVFLLLGFDQFARLVLQAAHYGLISHQQRYDRLSDGSRLVREIYGSVMSYRSVAVSRLDAIENNTVWQQAISELGEPNAGVLLGTRRSIFSPPINESSVNFLRIRDISSSLPDILTSPSSG
ncbi:MULTISPECIES: PFL_4669 family integrating conjugative element protein [Yersinia pseudotuberculosis complex]|uniref:Integrating conjugative element protein, PFL_4669 family n=1 Tax=Yersinia similis TaxID=367190 RepID=A0A0T9R2Q5_9GAMM|nr:MULTISPECIES: TIGR03761 family integrating conjugative element protein [Yersinia pseudotuberculosis complex]QES99439.1 TIGR03761 family integrating conjugative element protein [Yersinia pseudotuberculosis]CFU95089.1 integrating conjugative element protein%2C PFL_4669 family [Yersinia pseudotuberculosis]CNB96188.1 integrating conjugative element protein%2C PFL_4669 family [Yersinia pseudotuberculosis]CNF42750.1 integrating conjugative element protein%2C PFL_4669 family [Yersinia similis]CNI4